MEYKLSIIVPIYNGEKYVCTGLSALINQSIFQKMEIVIVDDGSTDRTAEKVLRFCNKYGNVKYIYQSNKGVSAARNIGIKESRGKLIGFFDIDDFVTSDYYENLLCIQERENADIAISDFTMILPNGKNKKHRPVLQKKWKGSSESLKDFFAGNYVGNNVFDKIFKKTILTNVFFPENYAVGEDMYFVYKALKNANVMYLDSSTSGYFYIFRKNSAMHSDFSKKYYDSVKLSKKMIYESKGVLRKYAQAHLIHEECKLLENMMKNNGVADNRGEFNKYKKNINNYSLLSAFKYLSKRQFLGLFLMRISPIFYMKIHDLMRIG